MEKKIRASRAWRRMCLLFFLCMTTLAAALLLGHQKDVGTWDFLVLAVEGDLPAAVGEQLESLPGLTSIGPVCEGELELKLDGFRKAASVLGVELETYPFRLSFSAGTVSCGNRLPLVLGNASLEGFEDEYQAAVTKRQKQLILSGQVRSVFAEDNTEGVLLGVSGTEEEPDAGIYGERSKVETLLEQRGKTIRRGVRIRISGRKHAKQVREALEQAAFLECREL